MEVEALPCLTEAVIRPHKLREYNKKVVDNVVSVFRQQGKV